MQRSAAWLFLALSACGSRGAAPATPPATPSTEVAAPGAYDPQRPSRSSCPDAVKPSARMSLAEARCYMVALINRDRAGEGLPPVELDDGAATAAGQAHAEDMARYGFLGHWGTDGSLPEQRATDAGGVDMVLENASCFVDEKKRVLDPRATFDAKYIERAEQMFFNESPPHDGHRRNILKPQHKRVGVGIAQPLGTAVELPVPCFSQEFVDAYGTYASIPRRVKLGAMVHVEGAIESPAKIAGVGLARVDLPQPLSAAEANKRRSYPVPSPYQMYWPAGFKTPIPLAVRGRSFAIDVPVDDAGKPGLYEVSVWARLPNMPDLVIVGLRTIRVD